MGSGNFCLRHPPFPTVLQRAESFNGVLEEAIELHSFDVAVPDSFRLGIALVSFDPRMMYPSRAYSLFAGED